MMILEINGSLEMTILDTWYEELDQKEQEEVFQKLKEGDYVISLNTKQIFDLKDFTLVYRFDLEVLDSTEYKYVNNKTD